MGRTITGLVLAAGAVGVGVLVWGALLVADSIDALRSKEG